jgi:CDP-diacylglycerol--serine O-phosphatidyltransferase
MNLPSPPSPRRRGIYILPNLFTTAALFCGFYAIVQAIQGNYEPAAIAIFVAMVFDGLDGRIARLTGTQSEFGTQYDSISDMVCFGAAPALIVFQWALKDLDKLGWIVSFIYCAGAALRLARFNTNVDIVDKRFFQGLPSPAAAALIAGLIWVSIDIGLATANEIPLWLSAAACVLTLIAGISMVSNVPFWSGKTINLRKSVPFIVVIALVLAFALGATYPPGVFFGLFVAYALSGYLLVFYRWQKRKAVIRAKLKAEREAAEAEASSEEESEDESEGEDAEKEDSSGDEEDEDAEETEEDVEEANDTEENAGEDESASSDEAPSKDDPA